MRKMHVARHFQDVDTPTALAKLKIQITYDWGELWQTNRIGIVGTVESGSATLLGSPGDNTRVMSAMSPSGVRLSAHARALSVP